MPYKQTHITTTLKTILLSLQTSSIFRNLKSGRVLQVCIFKSVQILAYFHIKYQYAFFHLQGGGRSGARPPKYAPATVYRQLLTSVALL